MKGTHFNLSGNSLAHMKATIIEQVNVNNDLYRKEREHFCIRKLNTFYRARKSRNKKIDGRGGLLTTLSLCASF